MAVLSCTLLPNGATLSINNRYQRVYKKKYIIETNDLSDDQLGVYLQALTTGPDPLPAIWTEYDFASGTDEQVFCQQIDINRHLGEQEPSKFWVADVEWRPPDPGFSSTARPHETDPTQDPVRYRVEFEKYTRSLHTDVTGTAIVNSLGLPFDPPIQGANGRPILVAVRNMYPLQAVVNFMLYFKNATNAGDFYGAPAHTAKVDSITMGDLQERNLKPYYPVTIKIEFIDLGTGTGTGNPDASWDIRVANTSWVHQHLDPITNKLTLIAAQEMVPREGFTETDPDPDHWEINPKNPGSKLSTPVNIRISDGKRLFPDASLPEFLGPFQLNPERDFGLLGI